MSAELIARLRVSAEEWWECCNDIHIPITEAADALEAAEAENARLRAERETYRNAHISVETAWKAAEAKLAKIDGIVRRADSDPDVRRNAVDYIDDIHAVLHPDNEGDET